MRVTNHKLPRTAVLLGALSLASRTVAQDPAPIVAGVRQVWARGSSGSVTGLPSYNVIPLVSGDEDSRTPALLAALGSLKAAGSGHVLATAESMLVDESNNTFDTGKFNLQALRWLDKNNTRTVGILSGHGTWVGMSQTAALRGAATSSGLTVRAVASITADDLRGIGVLIIGNSWGAFSAAELSALEAHVGAGNGLYLAGLGWSWPKERGAYPMNLVAQKFGLRWVDGSIADPTNQHRGRPVFHTFFPRCEAYLPATALRIMQGVADRYPAYLNSVLRTRPQTRQEYLTATRHVASGFRSLPAAGGHLAAFDASVRAFMTKHSLWYGMVRRYDKARDAVLAVSRATLGAGVVSASPLTASRLVDVEAALGIRHTNVNAQYRALLRSHGFVLLDNRTLNQAELDAIVSLMDSVRGIPRDLQRMTIRNTWSDVQAERQSPIPGLGVNIFPGDNLQRKEQQFPSDFEPRSVPIFMSVVAHEIAHIIDSAHSRAAAFRAKKAKLLQDAGLDDLQFLRGNAKFFQDNPQEFVASMANQFHIDSVHTLRLGLERYRKGKHQPLHQALFMLDLYKKSNTEGRLFAMDGLRGTVSTTAAMLRRDAQGRITAIHDNDVSFRIVYDANGNITDATEGWTRIGNGIRGTHGVPNIYGIGVPIANRSVIVRLERAARRAPALVVIGENRLNASLFGGTLVPTPTLAISTVTGVYGQLSVPFTWPIEVSGGQLFFQFWVFDANTPAGLSASAGLSGTSL